MQNNLIEPSTLPELPPASPIEYWVLEQSLVPAISLILAGVLTLIVMRHRPSFKGIGLPIGVALILVGIGIQTVGSLTITEREHLRERSKALVQSVADTDASTLHSLLEQDAELASMFTGSTRGADRIVQLATTRNPGVVQSAEVGKVHVGIYDGDLVATTQIRVRTQGSMVPSLSWWRVDWQRQRDSDPWLVTFIEPIWIQGVSNPGARN
jgi:hypothetical protein